MTIQEYLEQYTEIHYSGEKNVTRGWININCLWCDDPSWHLGIDVKTLKFNCYSCLKKGYITWIIAKLEKCSFDFAEKILNDLETKTEIKSFISTPWPDNLKQNNFPLLYKKYLLKRNFNPDFLIRKYKLYYTNPYIIGKWKFKIICPIRKNNRIVDFIGISVTKKEYFLGKNTKHYLYNFDTVKDICIITEGITDVWRLGDGAIATFGKLFTQEQIKLLLNKKLKKIYVMYDSDAPLEAEKLANQLSAFFNVNIYNLNTGDPADLNETQVKQIRKEIFNEI